MTQIPDTAMAKIDFCKCLIHPFQNDPGVSQLQRVMDDLLSGNAKIDARKTADLLNYFYQLSRNFNYYDTALQVSDWQPFFSNSVPFVLSSLIKYNAREINEKFQFYKGRFDKQPSVSGLQLLLYFTFYNGIKSINDWYNKTKNNNLPLQAVMENIIKDKLLPQLNNFVLSGWLASKWFNIKLISLDAFSAAASPWKVLSGTSLNNSFNAQDLEFTNLGRSEQLADLARRIDEIFSSFIESIKILSAVAEDSLGQSLLPLKSELQKQHHPHLALLFAFLKLFEKLQGDLNGLTKKHLDFFYRQILKLKSKSAVPDSAHIIFEIQKELNNHVLPKNLKVKDGKDLNKQDILFSLDDEIVVNKAKVVDTRTLFLNNLVIPDPSDGSKNVALLEGVYMAPNAKMADGVDKDFQGDVKNFYTLGNKESKYSLPLTLGPQQYPAARLGFILASPVLLLNEGTRTVTITLDCTLDEEVCAQLSKLQFPASLACCGHLPQAATGTPATEDIYPEFSPVNENLYTGVAVALNTKYYYVSESKIAELIKKGVSNDVVDVLRSFLTTTDKVTAIEQPAPYCYCPNEKNNFDAVVKADDFERRIDITIETIGTFFKKRKPLTLLFSGDKEWIEPNKDNPVEFTISPGEYNQHFRLTITAVLTSELAAVTFYNKKNLKEDFNTTLPLVKIELDDHFKLGYSLAAGEDLCCLKKPLYGSELLFSLYHFLRSVKIERSSAIEVQVCGLKNLIVQNDESVLDINNPFPPFGTRPDIIDFEVINPMVCFTEDLVKDASSDAVNSENNISESAKEYLTKRIADSGEQRKFSVSKSALEHFLSKPEFQKGDRQKIEMLLDDPKKNYCGSNLIGPNFYVGSKEVFCKNWEDVYINFNWKDKPADFRDYYKAYTAEVDPQNPGSFIYGLDDTKFQVNLALLREAAWLGEGDRTSTVDGTEQNFTTKTNNRKLFPNIVSNPWCSTSSFNQNIHLKREFFVDEDLPFRIDANPVLRYDVNSRNGFLKINLQNQDFLHKDYPYVLARQMMALGKLPKEKLNDAVYYDENGGIIVFDTASFSNEILTAKSLAEDVDRDVNGPAGVVEVLTTPDTPPDVEISGNIIIPPGTANTVSATDSDPDDAETSTPEEKIDQLKAIILHQENELHLSDRTEILKKQLQDLQKAVDADANDSTRVRKFQAVIPVQPWTPFMSGLEIDYKATATATDITLIHIYPFDGTSKQEEIQQQPTLFPSFCDEGTLYIGLEGLVPGNNLNILFQLAEATADTETGKEEVLWYYLDNNNWKPLRSGFEILDDATENLTTSGVIKFALPENMTNQNSVMPKDKHWIKATAPQNSRGVSETIGIHTQAMKVTFTNDASNDTTRLAKPLGAGQVSKLEIADAAVKTVLQPYETFNGQVSEDEGQFYVRVSELLRHKGRAIQKFDYERLVLDAFPQVFKAKCITHSFGLNAHLYKNDFPYAPGFVLVAVIPDLAKLKGGDVFGPKVPVSILEKIDAHIKTRISPFVRFKAVNPRYEKIHLCLTVKLIKGKDEKYYQNKLKEDLSQFIAPWSVGDIYNFKLGFGQCVDRSVIISFLERLDYIDFILALNMRHEEDPYFETVELKIPTQVCPKTPRSVLIAGNVEVCIDPKGCPEWESWYEEDKKQINGSVM